MSIRDDWTKEPYSIRWQSYLEALRQDFSCLSRIIFDPGEQNELTKDRSKEFVRCIEHSLKELWLLTDYNDDKTGEDQ